LNGGLAGQEPHRFFGKYRGVVQNNNDPARLGRVLARVPAIEGMQSNWALPSTPYAGPGVGMLLLPPVDALVWIEFEGGDADYPIWSGCFWGRAEDVPIVYGRNAEDPAQVKVLKTASTTVIIDDTADTGVVLVKIETPAVSQYPVTLTLFGEGAKLETGVCTITVDPERGVTATVSDTTIAETPEAITASSQQITLQTEPTQLTMSGASVAVTAPEVSFTVDAATSISSGEAISLTTGEFSAMAASTSLTTLLEVTGASNFVGAVAIEGALDVAGALAVEGAAAIAGGVAIEGGGVIDGAPII